MILLAFWGNVSDELTQDLMRWNAEGHPNPKAFSVWAKGRECPYNNVSWERAANFQEKSYLWKATGKKLRSYDLAIRLLKEKCILIA